MIRKEEAKNIIFITELYLYVIAYWFGEMKTIVRAIHECESPGAY